MAATRALLLPLLLTSSLILSLLLFSVYNLTLLSYHHHHPIKPRFPNNYNYAPTLDLDDNPLWPAVDETDFVVLTGKNFSEFVDKNRHVMVMFYAPYAYRSMIRELAEEFVAAAKLLKGEAVFATVDASVERGLGMKYQIPLHPTMHFFVDGVKKYLYGARNVMTSDYIMDWVKRKMIIGIQNITTTKEAVTIHISESKFVFGILDSLEGSDSEELAAASKLQTDIDFYRTASADVAQFFYLNPQIKRPALFLRLPGKSYSFDGQFTSSAIADFVSTRKDPPVITFTNEDAAASIFRNPLKQLWLFTSKNCSVVICTFEAAAKAFKGKLLFVEVYWENGNPSEQIAYAFGVTEDAPRVVAYNSHDTKKHVFNGEFTLNNIKSFAEDFLQDELLMQSDPASDTVLKLPSQSHASG